MLERVSEDIKTAMKSRDKVKTETLRYVKKLLLENKTSPKPRPEEEVVVGYSKQLKKSVDQYPEGSEQAALLLSEIEILKEYLPEQLDPGEVEGIIKGIISSLGDSPQMGAVMKELSPQIKGKFDMGAANQIVRKLLG